MAYSRWGGSCWYIYGTAFEPTRQGQALCMHLAEGGTVTLSLGDAVKAWEGEDYSKIGRKLGVPSGDLPEPETIRECLGEWIDDVRREFPTAPAGASDSEGGGE